MISRFAPSTTGEAHPGTLLSALLVWLDARARGGQALLRLEDLDHTRVKSAWADQLIEAAQWLGLDWDAVVIQSGRTAAHEQALDQLAAAGRLYPCTCSRADRAGNAWRWFQARLLAVGDAVSELFALILPTLGGWRQVLFTLGLAIVLGAFGSAIDRFGAAGFWMFVGGLLMGFALRLPWLKGN